jgi:hypothetical protein
MLNPPPHTATCSAVLLNVWELHVGASAGLTTPFLHVSPLLTHLQLSACLLLLQCLVVAGKVAVMGQALAGAAEVHVGAVAGGGTRGRQQQTHTYVNICREYKHQLGCNCGYRVEVPKPVSVASHAVCTYVSLSQRFMLCGSLPQNLTHWPTDWMISSIAHALVP